jgi:hypothetical protein
MADPHWMSYVAITTGVIGTLTGISGAVLGIMAYRRTNKVKEMELRLGLRKAANQADSDLRDLKELMPVAFKSHRHVASASGMLNSGAMQIWEKSYEADEGISRALFDRAYNLDSEFLELTANELEAKTANVHALQLEINKLTDKYKAVLATDEVERGRIRDNNERALRGG